MIIMLFSINVAFVMGNFKAVPKHAHCMAFLDKRALVTPTVVVPSTIIVTIKEKLDIKRSKALIGEVSTILTQ